MNEMNNAKLGDDISNTLRLKTLPVTVKFLTEGQNFPEKTRRPLGHMGKKITLCQAVTMVRTYGWTLGITREDLVCVPAALAFGFSTAPDTAVALGRLFCEGSYSRTEEIGRSEALTIVRLNADEYAAVLLAPLNRATFEPDVVAFYGNPAQLMRLVHAWTYSEGKRVTGHFGAKVECTEYLLAPFKTHEARIAIPGTGDRVFSMTQDDEIVFSIPGAALGILAINLREAGKRVGASYPITPFLSFQPEFPKLFKELGKEFGIS